VIQLLDNLVDHDEVLSIVTLIEQNDALADIDINLLQPFPIESTRSSRYTTRFRDASMNLLMQLWRLDPMFNFDVSYSVGGSWMQTAR
jgi:hypothetical protein